MTIAVAPELIEQPVRPQLPIRVPVEADLGGTWVLAQVLGSTANVLLLECPEGSRLPPLGTLVRLKLQWDAQVLTGRLAAHGVAGRFLLTIGERAIRRSRRYAVDLPGIARSAQLYGPVEVRVKDLSAGGARLGGLELPVGSDVALTFTPPGRKQALTVQAFVVRNIERAETPTLGVAFRLAQASMDVLGNSAATAATV